MVHGSVRHLVQVIGALAMTVLIAATWLGFRLSEGPLELGFLSPYVEDALTTPDVSVHLGTTLLMRNEASGAFEIRARAVQVTSGGVAVASIPDMTLSLSLPALLEGAVAPRVVRLIHPSVRLLRDAEGNIRMGPGAVSESASPDETVPVARSFLESLLMPPGGGSILGYLVRVDVIGGEISIEDQVKGRKWHAPSVDMALRRDANAMFGRFVLTVAPDNGGDSLVLNAEASVERDSRAFHGTASFSGLKPSQIAGWDESLGKLAGVDLPLAGTLSVTGGLDAGLSLARIDLASDGGSVSLPDVLGPQAWPVRSLSMSASMTGMVDQVTVESLRIDLNGPRLEASGQAVDLGGEAKIELAATIESTPVDELERLWPPMLAPNPRTWIMKNLSKGMVTKATIALKAHVPAGKALDDVVIDQVGGEVLPTGVTVQYLPPMPVVKNVSARCTFDADKFDIAVTSGELMSLTVPEGRIVLSGLSDPDQFADIALTIKGSLTDALKVADSKPLNYITALGMQPARIKGDAQVKLAMKFPLLADLSLDNIKLGVKADTAHVTIPDVALGLDLNDAQLALDIDTKGLDLTGKGLLGGGQADIKWRENFSRGTPFRSRYAVQSVMDDEARARVGLDSAPFQPPYMTGPAAVDLLATMKDGGQGDISIKADLRGTTMSLPGLNWVKGNGVAGEASAELGLAGGQIAEIRHFAVNAASGGLTVEGSANFQAGHIRQVTFMKAKWGSTDAKGTLTFPAKGPLRADLSGKFDAREMVGGIPTDLPPGYPVPDRHPHDHKPVTPLVVSGRFSDVRLSEAGYANKVTAEMRRDERDWQDVTIDGVVGDGKSMRIEIAPAGNNHRSFRLVSNDAGAVFRALDIFDNVAGGSLKIDGYFDDADNRQPLKGSATIEDFRLTKAPALARLLTVAALTGVVDVLSGRGIHFSSLDAPFTMTDGVLELADARMSGTELGLTAKGQIDLDHSRAAVEGTIVPVYLLNSALGNLPLIGRLFAAEKGGGIIAMNYSVKGDTADPSVVVNPLSALTPGFLRRLFNIFDTDESTSVRPEKESDAPAKPAE